MMGATSRWAKAVLAIAASAGPSFALPASAQMAAGRTLEPVEAVASTMHRTMISGKSLTYTVQASRLPIRDEETGKIHAWMFYVAYRLPQPAGLAPRPVTFLWSGGPSGPGAGMDVGYFGPKAFVAGKLVDNPASLLPATDLVFIDPVGTGYSRPTEAGYAQEFFSVRGDSAATAEFIRVWLGRYAAAATPVYLGGASYGTWRTGTTTERLLRAGQRVDGAILISGGILAGHDILSPAEAAGYRVPAQAAVAYRFKKLPPGFAASQEDAAAKALAWTRARYIPALERVGDLTAEEREALARELSRHTGFPLEKIDRKTLTYSQPEFRRGLLGDGRAIALMDMRETDGDGSQATAFVDETSTARYLRDVLQYRTDLVYSGVETGYTPVNGPALKSPGERWVYDTGEGEKARAAATAAALGPPGTEPWSLRSARYFLRLKVFVGVGMFDSMNSCSGNDATVAKLGAAAGNYTTRCYDNGHRMGLDPRITERLAADVRAFIAAPAPAAR